MNTIELNQYFDRIQLCGVVSIDDIRTLRRVLNDDIAINRSIAERLIALDRCIGAGHDAWASFLAETLGDLLLWGGKNLGAVAPSEAAWLSRTLRDGGRIAPCTARVLISIVQCAERVDESLTAMALSLPCGRHLTLH